jgi:prepilin-type N-terminal cleavage/methylation domain-containing protein
VIRRHFAFTLAELLVTIAIIAVLASLLVPVFGRAKASARKAVCISNLHQSQVAVSLYLEDYEDYFMPVNHRPGGPLNSRLDRTWVQMLLPYARSFSIFHCPEDKVSEQEEDSSFDQDLVPGDASSQYYTASQYVNTGYNYLYLAPIVLSQGRWTSAPRPFSQFSDPSRTLLFLDSIKTSDNSDGLVGGGSWLVNAPCRYSKTRRGVVGDTLGLSGDAVRFLIGYKGWDVSNDLSPFRYGGAWPWHSGLINIVNIDGSVRVMHPDALAAGCNVQSNLQGNISDPGTYLWDAQ